MLPAWLPHAITLVGGLLLVKPALRFNGIARTRSKFEIAKRVNIKGQNITQVIDDASKRLLEEQLKWDRLDQFCLFSGIALITFAEIIHIIKYTILTPILH